ncbi:DUF488 domain-containing protein [Paracandidimonas soli]|uniref:Uncharacterized protein YeaO (DUF488 family) n=1 Tax=Paracandidimonas soli TaxID=1917182 RepID=A0A4R3VGB9_9BURK|nr:DUF488 family protein [Paracandidimonas soli]TCV02778.1 uncharacterized protein YeaO (DUF488 family) [Paracandidimonas soli]
MPYSVSIGGIREAVDEPSSRGTRVLADRLWPRGLRKTDLGDIVWYRDASPEPALRKAFHDGTLKRDPFFKKYLKQLQADPDCLIPLMKYARSGPLQLLTATHDPQSSYLNVLVQAIQNALQAEDEACADREPSSPACHAHLDHKHLR